MKGVILKRMTPYFFGHMVWAHEGVMSGKDSMAALRDARRTQNMAAGYKPTATAQFVELANSRRIPRKEYNLQPLGNL